MWNTGANRLSNGWVPNVPRAKMFAIRRTPHRCVHHRMCWSVFTISPTTSLYLPTPPFKNTHQFHYKNVFQLLTDESGLKGLLGFSIRSILCPTSGSSSSKWSSCKISGDTHRKHLNVWYVQEISGYTDNKFDPLYISCLVSVATNIVWM